MNHFKKNTIVLFYFLLCLLWSCEKEKVNNENDGFSIQLTAVQDGRNIKLSWTETKVSTFAEYIVVRSLEPIPTDFVPTPFSQSVIGRLDEFEDNEFVDISPLLAEKIFYKIFVDIGGRFLQSEEALVDYEVIILDRRTSRAEFNPDTDMLYLMDNLNNNLIAYNYLSNESSEELLTNSSVKFRPGNNGNGEELYIARNNGFLRIYDAFSLDLKANYSLGSAFQNIGTNNNGQLYVINNSSSLNFRVIDADDGSLLRGHLVDISNAELYMLNPEENELMVVGNFEMQFLKFDDDGEILSTNTIITNKFPISTGGHAISADGQFIMPYQDGTIYDENLDLVNTVGSGNIFFEDYAFSSDGTRLFTADNSFLRIQQFSFPDLELEEIYEFSYSISRIFEDKGTLVIVGSLNDFTGVKTIIETINY